MRHFGLMLAIFASLLMAACQSGTPADDAKPAENVKPANEAKPAETVNPFAGKWYLDIVTDSAPHLVLQVADDMSATLVGSKGFNNSDYTSITFTQTELGINVVVEEAQKCGNRTVTYVTVKSGEDYTGYVTGPNANCKAGTFVSPKGSIKLTKQAS